MVSALYGRGKGGDGRRYFLPTLLFSIDLCSPIAVGPGRHHAALLILGITDLSLRLSAPWGTFLY